MTDRVICTPLTSLHNEPTATPTTIATQIREPARRPPCGVYATLKAVHLERYEPHRQAKSADDTLVDVVQQANLRMFIKKTTHDHAISESRREVRAAWYA